jgi:hypothetical protein
MAVGAMSVTRGPGSVRLFFDSSRDFFDASPYLVGQVPAEAICLVPRLAKIALHFPNNELFSWCLN